MIRLRQHWTVRYSFAVAAVLLGYLLRLALTVWVGPGLPPYITFYPVVMAVALLAGFWPGMLATALSAVVVGYFILPPVGRWSIASSLDLAGLVLFICMGLFISLVARLYTRSRDRAAAYERELGLREKEERLRRLYDSGMIGVIYWNMDGRITDANDKFLEMVGYTREDLQAGRIDWLAMTPPEHRHLDEASVKELRANGVNAAPFEKQYIRKDGTRLPAIVAGAMLDEARADGVAFVLDITAQKKAEEALRRQAQFPEENPNPVLRAKSDGRLLYANAPARSWLARLGWHDGRPLPEAVRSVVENVHAHPGPIALEVPDAQGGTFLLTAARPPGEDYTNLYGIDITKRMAAEEALRASEERLRLIGDNLPDSALYQYAREPDGSSRFLYVSAGIERLNGVRIPDVLRDPGTLHRQIPPDYLGAILEKEAQAHRVLSDFDAEVPMRRPDGELRWMRLHSRPRRMPDGCIIWDGVQTDITERRAAEEKLQNSERRFRALTEKASEVITILDAEGTIIYTAGGSNVLGYADDELTGKTSFDFVHPDDLPHVAKLFLDGVTQSGKVEQAEFRFRAKDGSWRWLLAMGTNLLDVPYVHGILVNSRDITERKQAEEELRHLNENLEQLVQERTEKLRKLAGELTLVEQRERKHLGRILHDGLQQYIVAAKMQLNGLHARIENEGRKQEAHAIEHLLDEAVQVSRNLAAELSPPILHDGGIAAGLEWLSRWMLQKHGLKMQVVSEIGGSPACGRSEGAAVRVRARVAAECDQALGGQGGRGPPGSDGGQSTTGDSQRSRQRLRCRKSFSRPR